MTDRAPLMLGVLWSFQVIAFALVGLRLYARLLVVQTYGWDDYCFNAAVALLFIYNVLLSVAAPLGVGKSSAGAFTANESTALLLVNISQSLVDLMAILVKASIAIFLLRIVASERTHRIAVLVPVVVMSAVVLVALLCLWFSCTPISYSWDLSIPGGQCNGDEQFVVALVAGLLIVVVEVFYASFPWFLVRRLQMPRKEKILVGSCMSFGYISALCSIYRLLTLLDLAYASNEDYFYTIVDLLIWHAADITTQLVSIGVTVCRPLYKDWLNNVVDHIDSVTSRSKPDNARSLHPAGFDGAAGGSGGGGSGGSGVGRGGFSVIALQTIGGSSVVPPPHGRREQDRKQGRDTVVDRDGDYDDDDDDEGVAGTRTMARRMRAARGGRSEVEHAAGGATVTVQRSWRVESSSRSVLLLGDGGGGGDAGSEEGILGGAHAWHCEDTRELEWDEHKV